MTVSIPSVPTDSTWAGVIRHWSRTCSGCSTTPERSRPSHGYTANTWKQWCGTAPAAIVSLMCSLRFADTPSETLADMFGQVQLGLTL